MTKIKFLVALFTLAVFTLHPNQGEAKMIEIVLIFFVGFLLWHAWERKRKQWKSTKNRIIMKI